MLELENIKKSYKLSKNKSTVALNNISIRFEKGKFYGIVGHSGSGKSTLIQILGLLDTYDEGKYLIDKIDTNNLSENQKAKIRMNKFGFVFQAFYLNKKLTSLENVIIPTIINKNILPNERKTIALKWLEKLGLKDKTSNKVNQLSGGEQQRVAIARALVNSPDIVIADEPTGNLDKENELMIFNIFKKLVEEENKTVIVVTHNEIIRDFADVIYTIDQGNLKLEIENENE